MPCPLWNNSSKLGYALSWLSSCSSVLAPAVSPRPAAQGAFHGGSKGMLGFQCRSRSQTTCFPQSPPVCAHPSNPSLKPCRSLPFTQLVCTWRRRYQMRCKLISSPSAVWLHSGAHRAQLALATTGKCFPFLRIVSPRRHVVVRIKFSSLFSYLTGPKTLSWGNSCQFCTEKNQYLVLIMKEAGW